MIATVSNTTKRVQQWFSVDSEVVGSSLHLTKKNSFKNLKIISILLRDFSLELKFEVIEIDLVAKLIKTRLFGEFELVIGFVTDFENNILKLTRFDGFSNDKPFSVFIAKTIFAVLSITQYEVKFGNNKLTCRLPRTIREITDDLQLRQITYRLMVIEKSYGLSLIPKSEFLSQREISNIAYCYHSIVDRKFKKEALSKIAVGSTSTSLETKEIFGIEIDLGIQQITIIESGLMEIESITTPTLPKNAFSKDIQKLIDLDEKLDSMVMNKYLDSFSNAFEGLTNEQIEAITERPNLEEQAFNF